MDQPSPNAADPKQVKKSRRREDRADAEWEAALTTVMQQPAGRFVVWRLLSDCHVYGSVFAPNATDMAYNAGRQDVGHELLAAVTTLQGGRLYLQMQGEAIQRQNRTQVEIAAAVEQAGRDAKDET